MEGVSVYALSFLDFEKAFDYVPIESLWNIMRSNAIPDKMAEVIGGIYMGLECAVIDRSVISYWLTIKYGVKMGCMMSQFLFFLSWTGS